MPEQKNLNIEMGSLLQEARRMRDSGYRLIQIGCAEIESGFEVNYSFGKDYDFINFKLRLLSGDSEIPSIGAVYRCAFIYENEINELFGLKIKGMAVDYKGNLYRISVRTPFRAA